MKEKISNAAQGAKEKVSIRYSLIGIMFWMTAIAGVAFVTNQVVLFLLGH